MRQVEKVLIRGNDYLLGARQEHHAHRDSGPHPEAGNVCLAHVVVDEDRSILPQRNRVVWRGGIDQRDTISGVVVELGNIVVDLLAGSGNDQGPVIRQPGQRFENVTGLHRIRIDVNAAIQSIEQINRSVKSPDDRQRRVHDKSLPDLPVVGQRVRERSLCEQASGSDRARADNDIFRGYGHLHVSADLQIVGIDQGVAVGRPWSLGEDLYAGSLDVVSVGCGREKNLFNLRIGDDAERIQRVRDDRVKELAGSIMFVIHR